MTSVLTSRRTIGGFVAGLALAGAVAFGVNVASPGHASTQPARAVRADGVASQPSTDGGCRVLYQGRC